MVGESDGVESEEEEELEIEEREDELCIVVLGGRVVSG